MANLLSINFPVKTDFDLIDNIFTGDPITGQWRRSTILESYARIGITPTVGGVTTTFAGNILAVDGIFSGNVSGVNGTFTGNASAVDGIFTGNVSGVGGAFTGAVSGTTGTLTGLLSGTTATFTGDVTSTNFILSSDIRHKENIKPVGANFISYNMKGSKQPRVGVSAQALEKTHPEFIRTGTDGMKSVAYIDYLCLKVADLEGRLNKIEA